MGSIICTAGFPSLAIASSCFTARCASIWYGFFIATLSFSRQKKIALSLSKGIERGVATFYDLPDIPPAEGAHRFWQTPGGPLCWYPLLRYRSGSSDRGTQEACPYAYPHSHPINQRGPHSTGAGSATIRHPVLSGRGTTLIVSNREYTTRVKAIALEICRITRANANRAGSALRPRSTAIRAGMAT